jgi:exosortase K
MKINQNTPYYITMLLLFLVLRFLHTSARADEVWFFLAPTSKIVALTLSADAVYNSVDGYFFSDLGIVINKSCSGVTFWLLSMVLLFFTVLRFCESHFQKLLLFPISAFICYILTVSVNASRILFAVKFNHLFPNVAQKYAWLHEMEGNIIYLAALMLFYLGVQFFIQKYASLLIKSQSQL